MPPKETRQHQHCRIEVECGGTQFGDQVCCVGASAQLGQWNPTRSMVFLTTDACSFPKWSTDHFPVVPGQTEFKFIIRTASNMVHWETSANRSFPAGVGHGGVLRAKFGMQELDTVEMGVLEDPAQAQDQDQNQKNPAQDYSFPPVGSLSAGKTEPEAMRPTISNASTTCGLDLDECVGASSHSHSESDSEDEPEKAQVLTQCYKSTFEQLADPPFCHEFCRSGDSNSVSINGNLAPRSLPTGAFGHVARSGRHRLGGVIEFKQKELQTEIELGVLKTMMLDCLNIIKQLQDRLEDSPKFHLGPHPSTRGSSFDDNSLDIIQVWEVAKQILEARAIRRLRLQQAGPASELELRSRKFQDRQSFHLVAGPGAGDMLDRFFLLAARGVNPIQSAMNFIYSHLPKAACRDSQPEAVRLTDQEITGPTTVTTKSALIDFEPPCAAALGELLTSPPPLHDNDDNDDSSVHKEEEEGTPDASPPSPPPLQRMRRHNSYYLEETPPVLPLGAGRPQAMLRACRNRGAFASNLPSLRE